ncbi:SDR family oxidoreductase [Gordonia jinhuaensis]
MIHVARIAVIGGHGKIAMRAERLLVADGHEVTAIIRNPDQVADIEATGATAKVADIESISTTVFTDILEGHDAVVWSAGAGGGNPTRTFAVDRDAAIRSMDATAAAAIDRYVMISYSGASLHHGVPMDNPFFSYAQAKAEADDYLRHTALAWTILGPSKLTDDPGSGTIRIATERWDDAQVSRDNVAAVIVAVIDTPGTVHLDIAFDDGDQPIREAITEVASKTTGS